VIITLCGFFCNDEVLNHAIEFTGEGVAALPIEARLTIANMTTEWGALAGVFPCDAATRRWFAERIAAIEARGEEHPRLDAALLEALATCEESVAPDPDAVYAKELVLDLDRIVPHVAGPDSVKVITPLSDFERHEVRIDKAYLVSCVNSRVGDLAEAARVVRGKRVAPHVSFYVAAASSEVEAESRRRGDWEALLAAGAIPLPPGCGPCIGLGTGLLEKGEVGISATNRNFKGRMGSKEAKAYLASPAVVAASAIAGRITGPSPLPPEGPPGRLIEKTPPPAAPREVEILPGFPEVVTGELLFCPRDNLNTDGIYPGKYTYIDDFTPAQQAAVAMENYDPHFQ
ncbi:MAG: homoaconitase, partial [Deltaproteobacteria bacterium]